MSKNTLVLDHPILINNEQVNELTYDEQEITVDLFTAAAARAAAKSKGAPSVQQTDYNFHLFLGMAAVIAVNPKIDFTDLERCKAYDLLDLSNIGLLFTVRKSAEPSEENSSEELSATTPATSTQA